MPAQPAKETLSDILEGLTGKRRQYLIFLIAGLSQGYAIELTKVNKSSPSFWRREDEKYAQVESRAELLVNEYQEQAIRLIRRDNQVGAALLERTMIEKIREELDTGDYVLLKTHLAREVYGKLIQNLDQMDSLPQHVTWQQLIAMEGDIIGKQEYAGESKKDYLGEAEAGEKTDFRQTTGIETEERSASYSNEEPVEGSVQSTEEGVPNGDTSIEEI